MLQQPFPAPGLLQIPRTQQTPAGDTIRSDAAAPRVPVADLGGGRGARHTELYLYR